MLQIATGWSSHSLKTPPAPTVVATVTQAAATIVTGLTIAATHASPTPATASVVTPVAKRYNFYVVVFTLSCYKGLALNPPSAGSR